MSSPSLALAQPLLHEGRSLSVWRFFALLSLLSGLSFMIIQSSVWPNGTGQQSMVKEPAVLMPSWKSLWQPVNHPIKAWHSWQTSGLWPALNWPASPVLTRTTPKSDICDCGAVASRATLKRPPCICRAEDLSQQHEEQEHQTTEAATAAPTGASPDLSKGGWAVYKGGSLQARAVNPPRPPPPRQEYKRDDRIDERMIFDENLGQRFSKMVVDEETKGAEEKKSRIGQEPESEVGEKKPTKQADVKELVNEPAIADAEFVKGDTQADSLENKYRFLTEWFRERLWEQTEIGAMKESRIKLLKVQVSERLLDKPVAIVNSKFDSETNQTSCCLEVNPNHPVLEGLVGLVNADKFDKTAMDHAYVLFVTALLESGHKVKDPKTMQGFTERMFNFMHNRLDLGEKLQQAGQQHILEQQMSEEDKEKMEKIKKVMQELESDLAKETNDGGQKGEQLPKDESIKKDSASANHMNDASTTAARSVAQLEAMSVREIKAEMTRLGVDSRGCLEKNDLIQKIVSAGYVSYDGQKSKQPPKWQSVDDIDAKVAAKLKIASQQKRNRTTHWKGVAEAMLKTAASKQAPMKGGEMKQDPIFESEDMKEVKFQDNTILDENLEKRLRIMKKEQDWYKEQEKKKASDGQELKSEVGEDKSTKEDEENTKKEAEKLLGLMRGLTNRLDKEGVDSPLLSGKESLIEGMRELEFSRKEETKREDGNA